MMNRLSTAWAFVRASGHALGVVVVWALAAVAIGAYMGVNLLFSEAGEYLTGSCASIPVILFFVAAVRNGLRFTIGWSLGLLALALVSFLAYGTDAGLWSFVMAGVAALVWMAILIFWALAYRPEEGVAGALMGRASGAMASVRNGVQRGSGGGVSIMTLLLVANLIVSLMGVLV